MTAISTKQKSASSKAGFFVLFFKLGPKMLSVLAKAAKALKFGKVALAAGSFAGYALLVSWQFAAVLMGSIFFHELGHIWAMKRHGMKTKGVYFLPFLGAAAVTEEAFPSRRAEVEIALMGPIWGFALALLTFDVYAFTESPLAAALAGWMGMINLFNLLPLNPLDGGRVVKSIAYSVSARAGLWYLTAALLGCLLLAQKFGLGLIAFLIFVSFLELIEEKTNMRRETDRVRILEALAGKLGAAPTAEAVTSKIDADRARLADLDLAPFSTLARTLDRASMESEAGLVADIVATDEHRVRIFEKLALELGTQAAEDELFGRNSEGRPDFNMKAYVRHLQHSYDVVVSHVAMNARQPHKPLIRYWTDNEFDPEVAGKKHWFIYERKPFFATGEGECDPGNGYLAAFLAGSMKPRMSLGGSALAFAAYAGLAAAIAALMFAVNHVHGADIALQMFTN